MRSSYLLGLLAASAATAAGAAAASALQLTLGPAGQYSLSSPAWPALSLQGAPLRVRSGGAWLSTADGSLALLGQRADSAGADAWGAFEASAFTFAAAAAPAAPLVIAAFRVYANASAIVFEARFPGGLAPGGGVADKDSVAAAFPSWVLPAPSSPLGFVQWAGPFINNGNNGPAKGAFAAPGSALRSGLSGGPLALLDASAAASLVLSAASQFMAVSSAVLQNGTELAFGPLGSAASLPVGYAYECVAFLGAGINANVMAYGAALLKKYGKPHGLSQSDFLNTHLQYNVDHGGFYYYQTGSYANYSVALAAVGDYAVAAGIPYRGVLLDSWWYFKGVGGGVKNWTAMPSIFTGGNAGIRALVEKTGWKITAHNRYWSANTDYATVNGGLYDFFVDPAGDGSMAVPLQQEFWEWLLTSSVTEWGLTTYEQECVPRLRATLPRPPPPPLARLLSTHALPLSFLPPHTCCSPPSAFSLTFTAGVSLPFPVPSLISNCP